MDETAPKKVVMMDSLRAVSTVVSKADWLVGMVSSLADWKVEMERPTADAMDFSEVVLWVDLTD